MTTETTSARDSHARLPQPRYARATAALIYVLSTLTLAYPALGGMFLINPNSDQYIAGYAFRDFAAQSLRSGEGFPLWNPYLYGGMPYVAAMHGDIFYPTFLLRMFLPTDVAMTWGFIIHVVLAGYFCFLLLRALGLSYWACVIGGLAYMLGGNVAGLVSPGHDGKLFVAALTPLTLYMVTRFVRDGRLWAWGLLALVVGLAALSPHPQLFQYMLLVGGAFALFIAFADPNARKLERKLVLRRLAFALGAIVLGSMIAAIQYLPVAEYVDWSPRAGGKKGWEHAISYSMPPSELFNTYLPQFTGMLDHYWGVNNIHLHSEYIGAAVMVLAGLAWTRRHDAAMRRTMWWATGMLVVAVLWALGGNTPFYRLVYAIVPGTKFFRAPSIMLYVVQFATAVLAALGTERVLRSDVSRRYLIGWAVAAIAIAVLASAGGLTSVAQSIAPAQMADYVASNNGAVVAGAWRSAICVFLALAALYLAQRQRIAPLHAAIALAAVVLVDLWSIERKYWMFMPPAKQSYAANDITRYLNQQPQPVRVLTGALGTPHSPRDPYVGTNILGGDGLMAHGVRATLGYHGNQLDRYDILAGRESGYQQIANPNFWALSNSQFFLTNIDSLPRLLPGTTPIMGPVQSPVGTSLYLYKLSGSNPFAWVAPAIVKADDEATTNTLLDPRFNVRQVAIFANDADVKAQQVTALPDPLTIETSTSGYKPGHFIIELSAPAPAGSALIVSENYYPGWSATVDSKDIPVWRADMSLMGVELPTGARRLEFSFTSKPYETGKLITLIALLLSVGAWVAGAAMSRKRGGATSGG
ncbi:MAG TPA: hypothetical protein VGQ52_03615 [Gemmatimonadaceae bacterium]|nr:hypothetical protein [Gemmatimonadaceae bacterium]